MRQEMKGREAAGFSSGEAAEEFHFWRSAHQASVVSSQRLMEISLVWQTGEQNERSTTGVWHIWQRHGCTSAHRRSLIARIAEAASLAQDDASALWSQQWQEWEHMSKLAKSASSARASCLAGELSRLRCLAPFPPLSPALNGPMMALLLSSPSVSISLVRWGFSYQIRRCLETVITEELAGKEWPLMATLPLLPAGKGFCQTLAVLEGQWWTLKLVRQRAKWKRHL